MSPPPIACHDSPYSGPFATDSAALQLRAGVGSGVSKLSEIALSAGTAAPLCVRSLNKAKLETFGLGAEKKHTDELCERGSRIAGYMQAW